MNPATGKRHARIAKAEQADVDAAVQSARDAYSKVWSKMAPSERGKYLFRIARIIQEKARELAILESMDGGKPIKESRDVDVPLVAAHFFYYAGWGRQARLRLSRTQSEACWCRGTSHTVEFPLADGGLENCACACLWKHCCAQNQRKPLPSRRCTSLRFFRKRGFPTG